MTTREFSFRQELLLEKGAAVIGDCMRYESKMDIKDEKIQHVFCMTLCGKQSKMSLQPQHLRNLIKSKENSSLQIK